jgi:hypothetical protein
VGLDEDEGKEIVLGQIVHSMQETCAGDSEMLSGLDGTFG